ncbi:hypothetical protein ACHAWF_011944, partial [Thalassiosira exigua]
HSLRRRRKRSGTMGAKAQPPSPKVGEVDRALADRALRALLKHHESSFDKDLQLLGDDLDVQVQFALARVPGNAGPKPVRVEVPHPLVRVSPSADGDDGDDGGDGLQDVEVCLIVKEESKPWVQDVIARFPAELGCVKKVLGLQSLRAKHKSFAQRRALLARFDVFLADDRILPMLTKALGGKFFEKKKQPVPLKLTRKEALPFAVRRCLRSTFLYLGAGTCLTVKAGSTAMPPAKLLANVEAICAFVPTRVPRKWSNVRAISVKTSSSVSLPIYNKTPEELEEISKLARENKGVAEKEEEHEDAGDKKKRKMATPLSKALKKQKAAEGEKREGGRSGAEQSSKTKKTRKESLDGDEDLTEKSATSSKKKTKESIENKREDDVVEKETNAPKSSKKKKKKRKESIDGGNADAEPKNLRIPKSAKKERKAPAVEKVVATDATKESKTPKSAKKRKDKGDSADDADFVASKTFAGAKKGYAFRKDGRGTGYYKDVLPKVDAVWLAGLGKSRGGGRKSVGHGMKKRRGHSRKRSM